LAAILSVRDGDLFREVAGQMTELTLSDRIWSLILDLLGLVSKIFEINFGSLIQSLMQEADYDSKLLRIINYFCVSKGHNYVTVLTDIERKKVVAVSSGTDVEAVRKSLGIMRKRGAQPKDVKKVAIDLSPAYTAAVLEQLPQATIIYDRFHLEQLLSKSLDTIRKQEQAENKELRKSKYLWLRNHVSLTKKQADRIHYLSITFPNLGTAYQLKEKFKENYNNAEPADVLVVLSEWIDLAEKSKLAPFKTFINTLKAHWSGIETYFHTRITSSFAERVNLKIPEIKRIAKGYRNLNNFISIGMGLSAGSVYSTAISSTKI